MRTYLKLGFSHIVPAGPDHILFVLGIFLLSRKLKPILQQVTAFTIAHTLTLVLASMAWSRLPPSVVEPLIALSIVFVAVENILTPELKPSRIALVFAFGLLHGLGFAGVLSELGLPALRVPHRAAQLQPRRRRRPAHRHRRRLPACRPPLPKTELVPPAGGRPGLVPDRGGGAVLVGAAGVVLGQDWDSGMAK